MQLDLLNDPPYDDDAPSFSSSLDSSISSVDRRPPISSADSFIFRDRLSERALFLEAVSGMDLEDRARDRYESCGHAAWVMATPDLKHFQLRTATCNHRLCSVCGPRRSRVAAAKLNDRLRVDTNDRWKFVTLTLRSSEDVLSEQLDHLRASFRRLRQTSLWRKSVDYGAAVIEVTYNAEAERWHPHLHIIMRSAFLPQRLLSETWAGCSGGSFIVHIRQVLSVTQATNYITKYMGKVPSLSCIMDSLHLFLELWYSIDGSKLQISFGRFPPAPEHPNVDGAAEEPLHFRSFGSLQGILNDAGSADPFAAWVLETIGVGGTPLRPPPDYEFPAMGSRLHRFLYPLNDHSDDRRNR